MKNIQLQDSFELKNIVTSGEALTQKNNNRLIFSC